MHFPGPRPRIRRHTARRPPLSRGRLVCRSPITRLSANTGEGVRHNDTRTPTGLGGGLRGGRSGHPAGIAARSAYALRVRGLRYFHGCQLPEPTRASPQGRLEAAPTQHPEVLWRRGADHRARGRPGGDPRVGHRRRPPADHGAVGRPCRSHARRSSTRRRTGQRLRLELWFADRSMAGGQPSAKAWTAIQSGMNEMQLAAKSPAGTRLRSCASGAAVGDIARPGRGTVGSGSGTQALPDPGQAAARRDD